MSSKREIELPCPIGEFLSIPIPPREKLLGEWLLSRGPVLIAGYTGCGKSQFVLGMAIALAQGGSFLDWKATTPRRVCLLDGELDDASIQERIACLSNGQLVSSNNLYVYSRDLCAQTNTTFPNFRISERRREVLEKLKGMEVVIFDNINCLFPGGDENSTDFWTAVEHLVFECRALGISPILVHHTSKSSKNSAAGSSKNERVAEIYVVLSKVKDASANEMHCNVEFKKTRHRPRDVDKFSVKLRSESETVSLWQKLPFVCDGQSGIDDKVLKIAKERIHDGESLRRVADDLGVSRSTLHRKLSE